MIEMHTSDWVLAAIIPTVVVVGFITYHCGKSIDSLLGSLKMIGRAMDAYRENSKTGE